jgi:hypothetical protein
LLFEDEVDLHLLPGVIRCWTRRGQQCKVPTPGNNEKRYGFGAVNFKTGRLTRRIGERKNSYGFCALVEGAWAYRFPARVSKQIQARQEHLPEAVRDIAWRAQVRLCKRFQKMIARGKNANIVVTAIARELAAFMWAIARQVPVAA